MAAAAEARHAAVTACHRELTALSISIQQVEAVLGTWHGLLRHHGDRSRAAGGDAGARTCGRAGAPPASAPTGRPIVILVHGYKFHPDQPDADPHRSLFALRPERDGWKIRSWPEGLGFADDAGETGLCVGFAWPASAPHLASLLATGRTGFAQVYDRAGAFGARLAELVALLQRLAPGRPIDLLAHSLGARVALAALPHLARAPGRMILLGAAEFDARAHEFLGGRARPRRRRSTTSPRGPTTSTTRCSRRFAPRRGWGERAIGLGLPGAAAVLARPAARPRRRDRLDQRPGHPADAPDARLCHWSFYTRDGALAVYQAILRRRPGWDIASLRATPCFAAQEPRWSRLLPRRPAVLPDLDLGGDLTSA